MNFSSKLRQLRYQKGLTQKKLGELTNLSDSEISKIETNPQKSLNLTTVRKLLGYFNITFESLFHSYTEVQPVWVSKIVIENLLNLAVALGDKSNKDFKPKYYEHSEQELYEMMKVLFLLLPAMRTQPEDIIAYCLSSKDEVIKKIKKKYRF